KKPKPTSCSRAGEKGIKHGPACGQHACAQHARGQHARVNGRRTAMSREPGDCAMSSPFPGMDPYLEDDKLWPGFQHQILQSRYQLLLPGLRDIYRESVAQRHYVSEQALFTSVIREEHHEQLIEIRQRSDGKMVTLVDVVSPANKATAAGRAAYMDKRRD